MPRSKNTKPLVIPSATAYSGKPNGRYFLVNEELYSRVRELSAVSGNPMSKLVTILLTYALDNVAGATQKGRK